MSKEEQKAGGASSAAVEGRLEKYAKEVKALVEWGIKREELVGLGRVQGEALFSVLTKHAKVLALTAPGTGITFAQLVALGAANVSALNSVLSHPKKLLTLTAAGIPFEQLVQLGVANSDAFDSVLIHRRKVLALTAAGTGITFAQLVALGAANPDALSYVLQNVAHVVKLLRSGTGIAFEHLAGLENSDVLLCVLVRSAKVRALLKQHPDLTLQNFLDFGTEDPVGLRNVLDRSNSEESKKIIKGLCERNQAINQILKEGLVDDGIVLKDLVDIVGQYADSVRPKGDGYAAAEQKKKEEKGSIEK